MEKRGPAPRFLRRPAPTLNRLVLVLPAPPVKQQMGQACGGLRQD